jgi:IS4 transposase
VYNTIPKSREWLIVSYVVNAIRTTLPWFYIFKRKRICNDYIQLCKPGTCMAMQSKAWMTTFLFKEFLSFFKRSIPSGISITNRHLFILDGHGSHVALEAIE